MADRDVVVRMTVDDQATKKVRKLDDTVDQAEDEIRKADKSMRKLDKTEKSLAGRTSKLTRSFGALAGAAGAGAALFMIKRVGGAALNTAMDFEQTQVSFETMLGSADDARKLLTDLEQFSLVTPFTPDEIINTSKKLLGFGIVAEDQIGVIRRLGDVASGMNIPLGDLAQIFGKTFTKGKVQAEELNQMAERGIPIIKTLAAVMGVMPEDIFQLASEGAIGFREIDEAFTMMTSSGGTFNDMMAKQAQTGRGLLSTLEGFKDVLIREFGTELLEIAKPILRILIDWAKTLVDLSKNTKLMKGVLVAFVAISVAVLGILIASLVSLAVTAAAASAAFWPIIAIAAGLGLAIGLVVAFRSKVVAFFRAIWEGMKMIGLAEPILLMIQLVKNLVGFFMRHKKIAALFFGPIGWAIAAVSFAFGKLMEHKEPILAFLRGIVAFFQKHKKVFEILFAPLLIGTKALRGLVELTTPEARAKGGPVAASTPYMVGERGPEIFVPSGPGSISASPSVGGARIQSLIGTLQINVRGPKEAAMETERAIMTMLDRLAPKLEAEAGLA